jgi:hypothetical protein
MYQQDSTERDLAQGSVHDASAPRPNAAAAQMPIQAPSTLARRVASTVAPALGVPHLVVGGVATSYYLPGRVTRDIDILVQAADGAQVARALIGAGCRLQGALSIGGSAWTLPDGTGLDVLALASPWVRRALAAPHRQDGVDLIALPYLVLMKLAAGRMRDEVDVEGMLAYAPDDALADVRRVVAAEMPERAPDLESHLFIGRAEHGDRPYLDT